MKTSPCPTLVLALLLAPVLPVPAAVLTIDDATFAAADWSFQIVSQGGVSSYTAGQVATGGNPGSYQFIRCNFTATAWLHVFAAYTANSYTPSVLGAIDSIDYSEDRRNFPEVAAFRDVNDSFALTQGGKLYVHAFSNIATATTFWENQTATGLQAADFDEWGAATGSPDFSASGGPIQFGYLRGSSTNNPSGDRHTESGTDNWSVTIHYSAIPEPAVAGLLSVSLMLLVRRRG